MRGHLVQQKHRRPPLAGQGPRGSQDERHQDPLLLSRRSLPQGPSARLQPARKLRPVRPLQSAAGHGVSLPSVAQRLQEIVLTPLLVAAFRQPSGTLPRRPAFRGQHPEAEGRKPLEFLPKRVSDAVQGLPAGMRDAHPLLSHVQLQGIQPPRVRPVFPQQDVAVPHRLRIHPRNRRMLRKERGDSPVQIPPPRLSAVRPQAIMMRRQPSNADLVRQPAAGCRRLVDPDPAPSARAKLRLQRLRTRRRQVGANMPACQLRAPNRIPVRLPAQPPSRREHRNRFQNRGLAGAVRPVNHDQLPVAIETGAKMGPKPGDLQCRDRTPGASQFPQALCGIRTQVSDILPTLSLTV